MEVWLPWSSIKVLQLQFKIGLLTQQKLCKVNSAIKNSNSNKKLVLLYFKVKLCFSEDALTLAKAKIPSFQQKILCLPNISVIIYALLKTNLETCI